MKARRLQCLAASTMLATVTAACLSAPAAAQSSHADRWHARAVESFRHGRFSEAYGRFVELAEVGHPASARYALWMCEHGLELFGKDWDCAPHQIQDWAGAANMVAPVIGARHYAATSVPRAAARR